MFRAWKQREEEGDWKAEREAARRGWEGVTMRAGVGAGEGKGEEWEWEWEWRVVVEVEGEEGGGGGFEAG